jgi:hypothetical protein
MAIRKILSSRFIIGYLLMVVCIAAFNSCNRTPCEPYRGYAPRYYSTLNKFVWTGCADPDISVTACEFKDVDKSRYIVVQSFPDRGTFLPIRGPYPDPDEVNQFIEQANGDYYFVNVDDFSRQATSASNGEYNYGGSIHRYAGTAIMIDYRYAEAKADAFSHFPCGGGVSNYDCMSSDFKQRLADCFYSEEEPEETGYVPYIIDHTACTPGDNFRVAVANTIVVEDCTPPYHIDTHWVKDQFGPISGDRSVYIGVSIDPFDPAKRYALYVEDGSVVIFRGELGYFNGSTHIAEVNPKKEPKKPGLVEFTVRTKLFMNASPLGNPQQRTYTVSVKEFVDNIAMPTGQVTSIPSVQLELNNRYLHQNVQYKERVMSIQLLGNVGTTFTSNVSAHTFHATFTSVWTNSEIHAIPHYLPSPYKPSITDGTPNSTPGNTVLPNYLVDKDGYGVIPDTDFADSDQANTKKCYEDLVNWWATRMDTYMAHMNSNEANLVNTLDKLQGTKLVTVQPPYQNQVSVLAIQGFKVYGVDPLTGELGKDQNGNLLPDVTATAKLPGNITVTAYRAGMQSGTAGATYNLPTNAMYHPVVVVDVGMITKFSGTANLSKEIMATTMHELAHAWFNKKVTDDRKLDGTDYGITMSHAGFVKGEGSEFCLMLYCPVGQEANFVAGTVPAGVMQTFNAGQLTQMGFSRSIQQRLANVMAITYDNQ